MIEFLRDLPFKTYLGLFFSGLFASYWLVPRVAWLARGLRASVRRGSANLALGGLSVGLPFFFGISLLLLLQNQVSDNMYMVPLQMRGLFFGSGAALALGLAHDILALGRVPRLVLQAALAFLAYFYGFRAALGPHDPITLQATSDLLFSLVWIVGLINLFDLASRLSDSFSAFSLAAVLVLLGTSFALDQYRTIVVCCLLAGSLLGHLSHSRSTRSALGSTGAYFLGFALAITTLQSDIIDGAIKILAAVLALALLATLVLLKLPRHFSFARQAGRASLRARSMHHYRLAAESRIQGAASAEEAWAALGRAAGEFGWDGLRLTANSGQTLAEWPAAGPKPGAQWEVPMSLAGGKLQVLGESAPPADARDYFSPIAQAYDSWREKRVLAKIARRSAPRRALLINRYYGGVTATGQLLEELAEDLAAAGVDVTVLTGDLDYEDMAALPGRNEWADGVHVYRVTSTQFGRSNAVNRMMDFLAFYAVALAWILKTAPDRFTHLLAFTDPPMIAIIGRVAQRVKRWNFTYAIQDLYPDTALALGMMRSGPLFRALQRLNRHLLIRADTVVTISEPMAAHIGALTANRARQVRIPNWADGDKIQAATDKDPALLADLGLEPVYTVIYAGNMGLAQEVDTLIELLKRCRETPGLQFLFLGGGVRRDRIAEAIAQFAIGNAHLLDYRPKTDLHRYLAGADIGIVSLTPAMEGLALPSKTYSYLAAGLPILAIADPDSELKDYAAMGLGAHFPPPAVADIADFLAAEAGGGSRFDRATVRAIFAEHFDRPLLTRRYADLINR